MERSQLFDLMGELAEKLAERKWPKLAYCELDHHHHLGDIWIGRVGYVGSDEEIAVCFNIPIAVDANAPHQVARMRATLYAVMRDLLKPDGEPQPLLQTCACPGY